MKVYVHCTVHTKLQNEIFIIITLMMMMDEEILRVDRHQMVTKPGGGGGQTTVPILTPNALLCTDRCFSKHFT